MQHWLVNLLRSHFLCGSAWSFVWPPIINAIETRQSQIANALASAEAAKKEQADTKNLVEQELSAAKVQAQDILDAANNVAMKY